MVHAIQEGHCAKSAERSTTVSHPCLPPTLPPSPRRRLAAELKALAAEMEGAAESEVSLGSQIESHKVAVVCLSASRAEAETELQEWRREADADAYDQLVSLLRRGARALARAVDAAEVEAAAVDGDVECGVLLLQAHQAALRQQAAALHAQLGREGTVEEAEAGPESGADGEAGTASGVVGWSETEVDKDECAAGLPADWEGDEDGDEEEDEDDEDEEEDEDEAEQEEEKVDEGGEGCAEEEKVEPEEGGEECARADQQEEHDEVAELGGLPETLEEEREIETGGEEAVVAQEGEVVALSEEVSISEAEQARPKEQRGMVSERRQAEGKDALDERESKVAPEHMEYAGDSGEEDEAGMDLAAQVDAAAAEAEATPLKAASEGLASTSDGEAGANVETAAGTEQPTKPQEGDEAMEVVASSSKEAALPLELEDQAATDGDAAALAEEERLQAELARLNEEIDTACVEEDFDLADALESELRRVESELSARRSTT